MTNLTIVFLHALGASKSEWHGAIEQLPDYTCRALDLPGFGEQEAAGYTDPASMADWLVAQIRDLQACVLVGHSMGGKIATLVAARASAGEMGLAGVVGVVLVAASPPSPEPMDDERRKQMRGWFRDGIPSEENAATFVDANTAARLPEPLRSQAIADVRRSSREAWLGWLECGANEDWSATVGSIAIPALIIAGAEDGDLDENAQRRLNAPHYPQAEVSVVPDAAHLIPYEQPAALAALIAGYVASLTDSMLPGGFVSLLGSDRVSRRTRRVMLDRARPASRDAGLWSPRERAVVTALVTQILPDHGRANDLTCRIEASLAEGNGDGWRFADLPVDEEAWRRGIATLDALNGGFVKLSLADQQALLKQIDAGKAGLDGDSCLSPKQMKLWFEDVRAEVVRTWVALPATMAAIGYDGFAVGGDGLRLTGYGRTKAGDVEAWQHRSEQVA
jgi:pimeloyl-ACP methyl ester carboxylesterase